MMIFPLQQANYQATQRELEPIVRLRHVTPGGVDFLFPKWICDVEIKKICRVFLQYRHTMQ